MIMERKYKENEVKRFFFYNNYECGILEKGKIKIALKYL